MGKHLSHSSWSSASMAVMDDRGEIIRVYPTRTAACKALHIYPAKLSRYIKEFGELIFEEDGKSYSLVEYNSTGYVVHVLYNVDRDPVVFQSYGAAIKWIGCAKSTFYVRVKAFLDGTAQIGDYDLANPIICHNIDLDGEPVFIKLVKVNRK